MNPLIIEELLIKNAGLVAALRGVVGMADIEIKNGSKAWKGAKEIILEVIEKNEVKS
jgi:hypothetical protein